MPFVLRLFPAQHGRADKSLLGVGLRGAPRREVTAGLSGAGTDRQIDRLVYKLYALLFIPKPDHDFFPLQKQSLSMYNSFIDWWRR